MAQRTFTMKTIIPVYQVDAFTGTPFKGNPAAVVYLMEKRSTLWMQQVASEMNLSETAFFELSEDQVSLRWFTPQTEVDLCGHATLATAHVLREIDLVPTDKPIVFDTRSGPLIARFLNDEIELDFPSDPPKACLLPEALARAIGVEPIYSGQARWDYLIEIESEEQLQSLNPDLTLISQHTKRGLCVTAASLNTQYDFVSRFFAPAAGVLEDPVTGSAHCILAPYWAEKTGRKKMKGYQCSIRGGEVGVELKGDRVLLSGKAVTTMQGILTLD